jgi:molecular chaperone DnaJ
LKIPAGTQSGERFSLHGEGVASLRGRGRGDMIVEVQVQTPTKLCKRQKELLAEFDDLCTEKEEEGFFSKWLHGHLGRDKKKKQANV